MLAHERGRAEQAGLLGVGEERDHVMFRSHARPRDTATHTDPAIMHSATTR